MEMQSSDKSPGKQGSPSGPLGVSIPDAAEHSLKEAILSTAGLSLSEGAPNVAEHSFDTEAQNVAWQSLNIGDQSFAGHSLNIDTPSVAEDSLNSDAASEAENSLNSDAARAAESSPLSESDEIYQKAKAILDKIPVERYYHQRDLSAWRRGLMPEHDEAMKSDPTLQGLDRGQFDPPQSRRVAPTQMPPPPPPSRAEMRAASRNSYTIQERVALKSRVVDEHPPATRALMRQSNGREDRPTVDPADMGVHHTVVRTRARPSMRPPVLPPTRSATQPSFESSSRPPMAPPGPSRSSSRGPSPYPSHEGAAAGGVEDSSSEATQVTGPAWAKISGPSPALQSILAGIEAARTGGRGPPVKSTTPFRAQDAIAATARVQSRPIVEGLAGENRHRTYPSTSAPPPHRDPFLADNRAAIPRALSEDSAPVQTPRKVIPVPVSHFVKIAEALREKERRMAIIEEQTRRNLADMTISSSLEPYNGSTRNNVGTMYVDRHRMRNAARLSMSTPIAAATRSDSPEEDLDAVEALYQRDQSPRSTRGAFERDDPIDHRLATINPANLLIRSLPPRAGHTYPSGVQNSSFGMDTPYDLEADEFESVFPPRDMSSVETQQATGRKRKATSPLPLSPPRQAKAKQSEAQDIPGDYNAIPVN
ncbi:uncharacterized protein RCC_01291 [Ramularia collo-cygni]|uniref:Uncharacterized protein n=1 Tax=Ramularia collo-cygni TaxID=112498 RepID=A0A2D3ULS6_9PEZI|nr:uncharacterized protein RCC_01291 [Ramularia collo-cygni]CZT15432.1 uncharacterized protein RCC_01291 [Ramularia collo-cygni]